MRGALPVFADVYVLYAPNVLDFHANVADTGERGDTMRAWIAGRNASPDGQPATSPNEIHLSCEISGRGFFSLVAGYDSAPAGFPASHAASVETDCLK